MISRHICNSLWGWTCRTWSKSLTKVAHLACLGQKDSFCFIVQDCSSIRITEAADLSTGLGDSQLAEVTWTPHPSPCYLPQIVACLLHLSIAPLSSFVLSLGSVKNHDGRAGESHLAAAFSSTNTSCKLVGCGRRQVLVPRSILPTQFTRSSRGSIHTLADPGKIDITSGTGSTSARLDYWSDILISFCFCNIQILVGIFYFWAQLLDFAYLLLQ